MPRILLLAILFVPAAALAGCSSTATPAAPAAPNAGSRSGTIHTNVVVRSRGLSPDAPAGWSPENLEAAYDLPSASKGTGQIVAVVDAYDNPNVSTDLASYRSTFGLPPANFTKYNQDGQTGDYPEGNGDWGVEIDLDVEMLSASCPNCTIDLVEANSNGTKDLEAALTQAVKLGAHVVSVSWGCEGSDCVDKSYFRAKGVEYLASAGDGGLGAGYPSAFDSVVAIGGTVLSKGGGGKRGWSESVFGGGGFGPGNWGTGAACSTVKKPSWQHDPGCSGRTANDVSAVADPVTGVAVYDTYGDSGTGWRVDGGTSVATPLIGGIFALAGNATSQDGGRTFWDKHHQNPNDLNPVLRGSDGHCGPTYLCTDGTHEYRSYGGPTGWGTPNGIGAF